METALPVAKSLELPIKVEPGICEILTVERWGKIFYDMAVIMVKIWGTYGEHMGNMNHHCLVVSIFLIWVCLKIGYIPNYSHLIGIMIINHWV